MKTFVIILTTVALLSDAGFCEETSGYSSHLQNRTGSYTWDISAARFSSTPAWTSESQPIPLSMDKACKSGRDWLAKHGFAKFDLDEVRLQSYPIAWVSHGMAQRRYYYWLMYHSEDFDGGYMYVYVLLDGAVVEPKFTPAPEKKHAAVPFSFRPPPAKNQ
jgi:hypothetical protein